MSMLNAKSKTFGNLAGHVKGMEGVNSLAQWTNSQFDPTLSWEDVAWIRSLWPGKLIVKGILDVEDAKLATKSGADAIVVSNHGGRQLDGAPSSIAMLPKIADAVGNDIEVMFDGGIRSGQDLFRALALGAKSCLIGRAYIYGLGALGKAGREDRDRDHPQGTRHHHGADRRHQNRRHRSLDARDRDHPRRDPRAGAGGDPQGGGALTATGPNRRGTAVMNASDQPTTRHASASSLSRRIVATLVVGGMLFLVLWLMALTALTSLLISAGFCVVLVAASTISDLVETMLNLIVAIVFGVLAAIAAVFAAIFSLFSS